MHYVYQAIDKLITNNVQATEKVGFLFLDFMPQAEAPDKHNYLTVYRRGYVLNGEARDVRPALNLAIRQKIRMGKLLMKTAVSMKEQVVIGSEVCTVFKWQHGTAANVFSFLPKETQISTNWLHETREKSKEDHQLLNALLA